MVQLEDKIITSISHYFFIKTYNKIYIFKNFQSICSEAPLNRKFLLLFKSAAKPSLELQSCFLPAPQESLKAAIIFGIPMVLDGHSSLPTSGARSQPGAARTWITNNQRFVIHVCANRPSAAFVSDQRENLPRPLTALPPATGGARSVPALRGFPEEATRLQHRHSPRRAGLGEGAGGLCRPGLPHAGPGPSEGLIPLGPVTAMAGGGRGCRRARRPPAPCGGDPSAGRLLLGRIPPRRDEPPVTLLGGRGRPPPVRAGPSLSAGMNSPSPPDPFFNSHTCTKARTGAPRGPGPPNPPLPHSPGHREWGMAELSPTASSPASLAFCTKPKWAWLLNLGSRFVPCWRVQPRLYNLVLISSWSGPSRPSHGLSPARPHCHSDCPWIRKRKENCGVTLGLWLVSDGDVPSCFGGVSSHFCLMALEDLARLRACADISELCDKGCRRCQFLFLNHLVWLCCAGGNSKEMEAQSTRTAAEPCVFLYFFFFFFFSKEAFSVLACWVLRE